jgi:Arc/MetJ-type ribon-helix-helix transcriptional regulator
VGWETQRQRPFEAFFMNVSLSKELEKVVQKQVESGLYHDAEEVISNAILQAYCSNEPDSDLDSPEIAEKIRHARQGKYQVYRPGDFDRLLERVLEKK